MPFLRNSPIFFIKIQRLTSLAIRCPAYGSFILIVTFAAVPEVYPAMTFPACGSYFLVNFSFFRTGDFSRRSLYDVQLTRNIRNQHFRMIIADKYCTSPDEPKSPETSSWSDTASPQKGCILFF